MESNWIKIDKNDQNLPSPLTEVWMTDDNDIYKGYLYNRAHVSWGDSDGEFVKIFDKKATHWHKDIKPLPLKIKNND